MKVTIASRAALAGSFIATALLAAPAQTGTPGAGMVRGMIDDRREAAPGVMYWRETRTIDREAHGMPQIPCVLHVVQIDLRRAQYRFEVRSGTSETRVADAPSSQVLMDVRAIAAKAVSDGLDVVAAINGDYWDSTTDKPLGVMVESGIARRLQNGRPALLVGKDHYSEPRRIGIGRQPVAIRLRGAPDPKRTEEKTVSTFNRLPARGGLGLMTDGALAASLAAEKRAEVYAIDGAQASLCNQWQEGRLRKVQEAAEGRKIDLATGQTKVFIAARDEAGKWLGRLAKSQATVCARIDFPSVDWPVWTAIGGGPMLVSHGLEADDSALATFENRPDPRTAVGVDPGAETMWWVVVDGRKAGYSVGATLGQLAEFMKALGASEAINLDGGGSSTLWLEGNVVNRPSDWRGPRGVANALLLCRRDSG